MSVPGQNIIELGWDIDKFDAQKKIVATGLMEHYELIQKISSTPISIGSGGGWGELKTQAQALRDAVDKLSSAQQDSATASKAAQQAALNEAKVAKEAAAQKLNEAKAAAENAKQLLLEAKAANELEKAKLAASKAAKPAEQSRADYVASVPFENRTQVDNSAVDESKDRLNDLERAQIAETQAANEWTASQRNAAAATEDAANSNRGAIAEDERLTKAKIDLAFALSEENVQLQGYKLQAAEATKAARDQAAAGLGLEKELEKEITDYKILEKAYEDAAARYKQLAILQRGLPINEKGATLAAAAEVKALDEEIKKLDADVGRANKSVGQYNEGVKQVQVVSGTAKTASTGFANSLSKQRLLFMDVGRLATEQSFGLRAIASNFALFGPAVTIAAAAVGGLIYLVTKHTEAEKAAAAAVEKHKKEVLDLVANYRDLSEVTSAAEGGTIGEATHVQALAGIVSNQTKSYKERNDALLQLKEINKNYFGDLTLEQASLIELTKRVNEYTNALVSQAIIHELEGDIGKVGAAYFRQSAEIKKTIDQVNALKAAQYSQVTDANGTQGEKGYKIIEQIAKLNGKLVDQVKILTPLEKQYFELKNEIISATEAAEKFKPLKEPSGLDKGETKLKTVRDKDFDQEKKDYIEQQKKLSEIVDFGFSGRLVAINNAYGAEAELINKHKNDELDIERNKLRDVIDFKKSTKNQKINAENEYNAAVSYINKKYAYDEAKLLYDHNSAILDIQTTAHAHLLSQDKADNQLFLDEQTAAYEKQLKTIDDANKKAQNQISETRDYRLEALEKKKNKGKFDPASEKEYQSQKLKIEHDALNASLKQNIEYTEKLIALDKARGVDTSAAEAKLASFKKQLAENDVKLNEEANKKKRASYTQYFDAIKNLTSELITLITTLGTAGYEKQKNAIQGMIDKNNEWGQAEVDRITNSTLSEQDKADKITQIKAEQDLKNKQLEREQKQQDIKKARFEKAAAIANIILNTAAAVSKALFEGGPFYAILVGALGAAQLANAIATPIPTYAEGTDNHPGGDAVVGEGRHKELVRPKGGKSFVADRPMYLRNLAPESQVIPLTDSVINEYMQGSSIANIEERRLIAQAAESKRGTKDAWDIAKWQAEENRKAIKESQKDQTIVIKNVIDGQWSNYVRKNITGT